MPCTHGPRHPYPPRPEPLPPWDRLDWFRSGAECKHVSADLDQYSCASPYPSLAGCSPLVPSLSAQLLCLAPWASSFFCISSLPRGQGKRLQWRGHSSFSRIKCCLGTFSSWGYRWMCGLEGTFAPLDMKFWGVLRKQLGVQITVRKSQPWKCHKT